MTGLGTSTMSVRVIMVGALRTLPVIWENINSMFYRELTKQGNYQVNTALCIDILPSPSSLLERIITVFNIDYLWYSVDSRFYSVKKRNFDRVNECFRRFLAWDAQEYLTKDTSDAHIKELYVSWLRETSTSSSSIHNHKIRNLVVQKNHSSLFPYCSNLYTSETGSSLPSQLRNKESPIDFFIFMIH